MDMNDLARWLIASLKPYFLSFDGTRDLGRGTAFPLTADLPGGLQTNDRFFRTDELATYAYNGTAWVLTNGSGIRARMYRTTDQTIANATLTQITFSTARWDTDGLTAGGAQFTARRADLYRMTAQARFAANATGQRVVYIRLNGTTLIAIDGRQAITVAATPTDIALSTEYELVAGNTIQMLVYQDSGGALNVTAAGNYSPEFSMSRIA